MKGLSPYLTFNGNCREAVTFYKNAFGGELKIMTFGEAPHPSNEENKNLVMHAQVVTNNVVLMASDTTPENPVTTGNSVTISLDCASQEEADRYFKNLSEGGKVTMPLNDTFWGAYFGMLTDKFGMHWMLNFDKNPQKAG